MRIKQRCLRLGSAVGTILRAEASVRRFTEAHGHGKIRRGCMVGTQAADMIGLIAMAIDMGAEAVAIGKCSPLESVATVAATRIEPQWGEAAQTARQDAPLDQRTDW